MTLAGWYQGLNQRERRLVAIVGAIIFLLLNWYLWGKLLGALNHARADLATRQQTRKVQEVFIRERALWEKKAQWLKEHQPTLKGPGDASTLLDEIKQIAGKHNVLIENPAIGTSDVTPDRQAVFASFEVKSAWPPLVHFLYEVQQPESFVVFESITLNIDAADPTQMRGKMKIARWFAPAGK
jgi:Type II secretion system (T2SS), protein M